jgi:ankyrin repeat protein
MDPVAVRLMDAALWGSTADVVRLLDAGVDPNARNEAGATPLMRAVDDFDTTQALLEYGADPNVKSDEGRTPLLTAAQRFGAAPVVRLLLSYGANPAASAPGLGGTTSPLIEASYRGDAAVMRLLLDERECQGLRWTKHADASGRLRRAAGGDRQDADRAGRRCERSHTRRGKRPVARVAAGTDARRRAAPEIRRPSNGGPVQ